MTGVAPSPVVLVEVNGSRLPEHDLQALTHVMVVQGPSLPSLCELTFSEPRGALERFAGAKLGDSLRVSVGDPARALFDGETTALEFGFDPSQNRALKVRGYDLLQRLRKRRPQRVHLDLTLADLAAELTADLGISCRQTDSSPVWKRLIQHDQSDLTLLRRIAEQCGLHFWLDGRTLRFFSPEGGGNAIALRYGENLFEASVELNSDPAASAARSQGWNPWTAEARESGADHARLGHRIGGASSWGEETVVLTNRTFQTDDQAEAAAQAELDRRAGRAVVLTGAAAGDPGLRPGAAVQVEGLTPDVSGRYALMSVTHWIDADRGYVTEFSTLSPKPSESGFDRAPGVALGVVRQVDDPEGLGRVKVELASCGGLESDWLQTIAAGAGEGKGLVSVPDVGDRVAVLFLDGDVAQGVVLGGLYGSGGPSDAGVEAGRVRRLTLRSASGHLLRFDDANETLRIENGLGSFVDLAPQRMVLHAEGDLEIEAPGKSLVLRAATVDFQQG